MLTCFWEIFPPQPLVWKDPLFLCSGPVPPLGSLKLGGTSTPTPAFLPPPLPHRTLLPTLPEVSLPGEPLSPRTSSLADAFASWWTEIVSTFKVQTGFEFTKTKARIQTWARGVRRSPTGKNWTGAGKIWRLKCSFHFKTLNMMKRQLGLQCNLF